MINRTQRALCLCGFVLLFCIGDVVGGGDKGGKGGDTPSPSGGPTLQPTPSPVSGPSPTPEPSIRAPVIMPTPAPVVEAPSPTPDPVMATPTSMPATPAPTPDPTPDPTPGPTLAPTPDPTSGPTSDPTSAPTGSPSVFPSLMPSEEPSIIPSEEPSIIPSEVPSLLPSVIPSSVPSVSPSLVPSISPTVTPVDVSADEVVISFVVQDEEATNTSAVEQEIASLMIAEIEKEFASFITFDSTDVFVAVFSSEGRRVLKEQVDSFVLSTAVFRGEPHPTTEEFSSALSSYFADGTGYADLENAIVSDTTGVQSITDLSVSVGGMPIEDPTDCNCGGGANAALIGGLVAAGVVLVAAVGAFLWVREKRRSSDAPPDDDDVPGEEIMYLDPMGAEPREVGATAMQVEVKGAVSEDGSLFTSATRDTFTVAEVKTPLELNETFDTSVMDPSETYDSSRLDKVISSAQEQLQTDELKTDELKTSEPQTEEIQTEE